MKVLIKSVCMQNVSGTKGIGPLLVSVRRGKGGWFIWGICVVPMLLLQIFPQELVSSVELTVPVLAVLFMAGFLWSLWSLLHAVVRQ